MTIQNPSFDLGFPRPRLARLGYRHAVVDTVPWARKALPGLPKRGLDAFAFDLGEVWGRHRALVNVTARVAHEITLTAGTPRPLGEL